MCAPRSACLDRGSLVDCCGTVARRGAAEESIKTLECGAASQTAHIASEGPLHSCNGELVTLNTRHGTGFATCNVTIRTITNQTQEYTYDI